jgi:hypothetical protein
MRAGCPVRSTSEHTLSPSMGATVPTGIWSPEALQLAIRLAVPPAS